MIINDNPELHGQNKKEDFLYKNEVVTRESMTLSRRGSSYKCICAL
jgi:hypothetical protein